MIARGMAVLVWCVAVCLPVRADPLPVVPAIDPDRYQGRWYEIARLPNFFQRKCAADVFAGYTVRPDGLLGVRNQCTRADGRVDFVEGVAKPRRADGPNTQLVVSFLPPALRWIPFTWGDYWIVELGERYDYAVVGTPGRGYLWILARAKTLEDWRYRALLERVGALGFDTAAVVRTVQTP